MAPGSLDTREAIPDWPERSFRSKTVVIERRRQSRSKTVMLLMQPMSLSLIKKNNPFWTPR
jgi:hypothetical protein